MQDENEVDFALAQVETAREAPHVEAHRFIALCHASGVSPQSTLRGLAAMLCGLRYDEDNCLLPLDAPASR